MKSSEEDQDSRLPAFDRPGETWRPVRGLEGTYAVSSDGRLRREAGSARTPRRRLLRPCVKDTGCEYVDLSLRGRRQRRYVHDVVSEAFMGRRPAGHVVHHVDGNKRNNTVENLTYVTSGENQRLAYAAGAKPRVRLYGASNPGARLTDRQVREIRRRIANGSAGAAVATRYGTSTKYVQHLYNGVRRQGPRPPNQ